MSIFEPYERLVRIVILGKAFEVPENNVLLRQLQYLSPDIGYGRYCWNGECRYCEVSYRAASGRDVPVLACLVKGPAHITLTKLAPEVRYNLSEALAAAPPADASDAEHTPEPIPAPLPPQDPDAR